MKYQTRDKVRCVWGVGYILHADEEYQNYIIEGKTDKGFPFINCFVDYEILEKIDEDI